MSAEILKFAISTLTAGGAITLILGYLGKQLIEHLNKRELERAKNEFSRELESHKSQLSLVNIHQSKLYDKRAPVIMTTLAHDPGVAVYINRDNKRLASLDRQTSQRNQTVYSALHLLISILYILFGCYFIKADTIFALKSLLQTTQQYHIR